MSKSASAFELLALIGLGIIAFAALFLSPLSIPVKVFLGASILLLCCYFDLQEYREELAQDVGGQIQFVYAQALLDQAKGESVNLSERVNKVVADHKLRSRLMDPGQWFVIVTCGKYAAWVLLGGLISLSPALRGGA